jgi:hypothetical protein
MAMNAAERMRREFSLDITVTRYAESHEELVGRRARGVSRSVDDTRVSNVCH